MHMQLPPLHVPMVPHCELAVQAAQTLFTQAWPVAQSWFVLHAMVHVPEPQACPAAQSLFDVHAQYRVECVAVHLALGPHWASVEQAPQVPPLHTWPAGQFAFEVQPVIIGMQPFPVHARHAWSDVQ
jgi:hypothetical protein